MENNVRYVTRDHFDGRSNVCDERFARDKERIKAQEEAMQEVRTLTVQMGEILKKFNDSIGSHEKRLCELERQPTDQYNKVKLMVTTAIVSGVIGSIITAVVTLLDIPKP